MQKGRWNVSPNPLWNPYLSFYLSLTAFLIRFRWAALQLKEIEECSDQSELEHALANLPKDLNTTYSRTLEKIPKHRKSKAIRLLQFLLYAKRPLTLDEAVDILAVQLGGGSDSGFHPDRRMPEPTDITKYYPDLVAITRETTKFWVFGRFYKKPTIRLAHFSVKEYLRKQADFSEGEASVNIARTCTAYLPSCYKHMHRSPQDDSLIQLQPFDFAFKDYITDFLGEHAHQAERFLADSTFVEEFFSLVDRFYLETSTVEISPHAPMIVHIIRAPLVWASYHGLSSVLERLLATQKWGINMEGIIWDYFDHERQTGLYFACKNGHESIVRLLLEKDADFYVGLPVNYPLRIASRQGYLSIVQLLVDRGADIIHPKDGSSLDVLETAAAAGHLDVVRYFVGRFSNKSTIRSILDAAIVKASSSRGPRQLEIVQELAKAGGDIHGIGLRSPNALEKSSSIGNWKVVRYLIGKGVKLDRNVGDNETALQNASFQGNFEVCQLLLEAGAKLDSRRGALGAPLQVTSRAGNLEIVRLLLEHGAKVNIWEVYDGTALQAASVGGNLEVARFLVKKGAKVNIRGGYHGTALRAASTGENLKIAHFLLKNGAKAGIWGAALRTVTRSGNVELFRFLLNEGEKFWMQKTLSRVDLRQPSQPRPRPAIKKRLSPRTKSTTPLHLRKKQSLEKTLERMAKHTAVRYLRASPRTTVRDAGWTKGTQQDAARRRYTWRKQKKIRKSKEIKGKRRRKISDYLRHIKGCSQWILNQNP